MPPESSTNTPETAPTPSTQKSHTIALILGVASVITWIIPLIGLPVSIVGIMKGRHALKELKSTRAIVGLTLSIMGLILSLINAAVGAYMGATGQHPIVNDILNS